MSDLIGLREAAEQLGLHYMTVYRYVRTGRLPAVRDGGRWLVDVDALRREPRPGSLPIDLTTAVHRLADRLVVGDEAGSWAIIEAALAGGADPADIHLSLLAPAMRCIGDDWAAGRWTVAHEHRATVVAQRLLGRLGPRFVRPGRTRGTVVLGAAPGDHHSLPCSMVADLLRSAGFEALDLGANPTPESFAGAARGADRLVATLICATTPGLDEEIAAAVQLVRAAGGPVLVGGSGIDGDDHAVALGADGGTGASGADVVTAVEALVER